MFPQMIHATIWSLLNVTFQRSPSRLTLLMQNGT